MALESRLVSTWSSRSGSAAISTWVVSLDELHAGGVGHGRHAIHGLAHELASCTLRKTSGSRPLCMRSRSRMSLIRRSRRSELARAMRSRLAALSFSSTRLPCGEQAERAANGGERGAQLVADGGDELILEAVEGVALADVAEAEHGAGETAVIEDRGDGVVDAEGAAVDAVEGVFAGGGHELQAAGGAEQGAIVAALAVRWARSRGAARGPVCR